MEILQSGLSSMHNLLDKSVGDMQPHFLLLQGFLWVLGSIDL